jgi:dephospho-CoA kinase
MKVIAICGLPGSGKSTAIEAIKDLGDIITMGDVVRNEAKKRNIAPTSFNLGKLANKLRQEEGKDIIAKKCIDLIQNQFTSEVLFIDGIRSISEVNLFRKFWKFPIISIILNAEERFKRLFNRGRSDDPKDVEEFKERDKREEDFGLIEVLKIADYSIVNNSTIEDLKKRTGELVQNIIKNY